MKRIGYGLLGIAFAAIVLLVSIPIFRQSQSDPQAIQRAAIQTTVVVNTGDRIATFSGIPAATAFDALRAAVSAVTYKQYDFGVFVESVDGVANTKEKSWIYFVNGQGGMVAADTYMTKNGDVIEWRYMKPEVE